MSLIQCTNGCKFQKDGYCTLEKAGVVSNVFGVFGLDEKAGCLYYQPKQSQAGKAQQNP